MHALLQAVGLRVTGGSVTIGGHPRVQDVLQTVSSHLFEGVIGVAEVAGGAVNCGSVLGETVVVNEIEERPFDFSVVDTEISCGFDKSVSRFSIVFVFLIR